VGRLLLRWLVLFRRPFHEEPHLRSVLTAARLVGPLPPGALPAGELLGVQDVPGAIRGEKFDPQRDVGASDHAIGRYLRAHRDPGRDSDPVRHQRHRSGVVGFAADRRVRQHESGAETLLPVAGVVGAADLQSGLQVGDHAGPFNVKDITGPNKGKSLCYR
jgi:hypothetical protein